MFDFLISFWADIWSVFVSWNSTAPVLVNAHWTINGVYVEEWFNVTFYSNDVVRGLAFLTLLGACIYLFYLVYSVIHAFIEGAYRQDVC